MKLACALSTADYQVDIFPYVLASAYFCDGISVVHTTPFPNKETTEKIKWYIEKFPKSDKKVTFDEIPWQYPDKPAARQRGYKTTSDKRFEGIAGPETQSLLNAIHFNPFRVIYTAGDQIFYEHWVNVKPWIKYHAQISPVIRNHITNFGGENLVTSLVTDPKEYGNLIARNQDWDSQCTIVEPGICCEYNEGAICYNDIPCPGQPTIRTLVEAHFREWSPLSNPDEVKYQRALTRVRIRNMNNEYPTVLTEDEEVAKAKSEHGTWAPSGIKVGSTWNELLTPPAMPVYMTTKAPWELVGNPEIGNNAWIPDLRC